MKKVIAIILSLICVVSLSACNKEDNIDTNLIDNSEVVSQEPTNSSSTANRTQNDTVKTYTTEKVKTIYDSNMGLRILVRGEDIPEFSIIDPEDRELSMENEAFILISGEGYIGVDIEEPLVGSYKIKYLTIYKDKITIESEYLEPFVIVNVLETDSNHIKFNLEGLNVANGTYSIDALKENSDEVIFINIAKGDLNGLEYDIPIDTNALASGEYTIYVNINYELNKAYEMAFGKSNIINVAPTSVSE